MVWFWCVYDGVWCFQWLPLRFECDSIYQALFIRFRFQVTLSILFCFTSAVVLYDITFRQKIA